MKCTYIYILWYSKCSLQKIGLCGVFFYISRVAGFGGALGFPSWAAQPMLCLPLGGFQAAGGVFQPLHSSCLALANASLRPGGHGGTRSPTLVLKGHFKSKAPEVKKPNKALDGNIHLGGGVRPRAVAVPPYVMHRAELTWAFVTVTHRHS